MRIILLSSCFLKREKERKYWVHPILRFPLLIKEQRDYHGWFKVYFRTSVAQFDALLAILEPHIKKKTTDFCELSVQGSIYSVLCCEMKWMNLTIAILDFGVCLYGGSELSKHLSKCLLRMRKTQKIEPDPNCLCWTKVLEAVCKCDWHNMRSYLFFNVRKFWTKI